MFPDVQLLFCVNCFYIKDVYVYGVYKYLPMARVVYWSMQENSVGVAYYGRGRNELLPPSLNARS